MSNKIFNKIPVTGVINTSNCYGLIEDMFQDGIDIDFEEHCLECNNEYHDDCYYNDEPTYLIGFYYDNATEQYEIDDSAEYSAIVGPIYTQIVHSKYVALCAPCSPCFPGQGDLDTTGNILTYGLPDDMFYDGQKNPSNVFEYNKED